MPIDQMAEKFPEAYAQFVDVCKTLEDHYRDMQDMEFTVEHGKLYMLQTRNGKRTAPAALKIACDLVDEGMISGAAGRGHDRPRNLDTLLHPQFDPAALKAAACGQALPASPGAACARSSTPPRTPRNGLPGARRWSWSVWRPLPRISRA